MYYHGILILLEVVMDYSFVVQEIISKLYYRDVDYSLNVFLCGAHTERKQSIRSLLNEAFKREAKFHAVYPEYIFKSLFSKKTFNLLELESDLAKWVDLIVLPLEGYGTFCELGAFAVNEDLRKKMIVIMDQAYKHDNSFINLGPVNLIIKNNKEDVLFFEKDNESEIVSKIMNRVRYKKFHKEINYDFSNLFNLSRLVLYFIAIYQPIYKKDLVSLLKKATSSSKIKIAYIDSVIEILAQKNRIEFDIDANNLSEQYILSQEGHNYVYEELIEKLNIKRDFTLIRSGVINYKYKSKGQFGRKVKKLLV